MKSDKEKSKLSAFQDLLTLLMLNEHLSRFNQAYICVIVAEHGLKCGYTKEQVIEWAYDSKKHMAIYREENSKDKIGRAEAISRFLQYRADKVLLDFEIGRQASSLFYAN